jgi:hypothetical protein
VAAKKVKSTRYELMAMKVGDFGGKTEVLAEVSLNELKTIERIAKALAGDKSGVLLETVKKHVNFWEDAGKNPDEADEAGRAAMRAAKKSAEDTGARAYERKYAHLPWDLKLSLEREDGSLVVFPRLARFRKKSHFTPEMRRGIVIAVRREIALSGAGQAGRKPAERGRK